MLRLKDNQIHMKCGFPLFHLGVARLAICCIARNNWHPQQFLLPVISGDKPTICLPRIVSKSNKTVSHFLLWVGYNA